jgi:cupin fold WbuC family metalloprotein
MQTIDLEIVSRLSAEAVLSERKRKNLNFHHHLSDPINRMLNAIEPGSYVQPHKHENPDKREVFIILRGSLAVFYFDAGGLMNDHTILSAATGCFGIEVEPRRWHSVAALEPGTVVYEVKDGPYNPLNDKIMASWAPVEGDPDAEIYLADLLKAAKLKVSV